MELTDVDFISNEDDSSGMAPSSLFIGDKGVEFLGSGVTSSFVSSSDFFTLSVGPKDEATPNGELIFFSISTPCTVDDGLITLVAFPDDASCSCIDLIGPVLDTGPDVDGIVLANGDPNGEIFWLSFVSNEDDSFDTVEPKVFGGDPKGEEELLELD